MKSRKEEILKLLLKEGKVSVKNLSQLFSVSEVSIRKDLSDLEAEGQLKRTHGGAQRIITRFTCKDLNDRKNTHQKEKFNIAQKSFDIIEDSDVIYLDSSSINIYLAQLLVLANKNLTVVTNMLEIINILSQKSHINLYVLPGFYLDKAGGFVGHQSIDILNSLNIDKAFVGCSGLDLQKKQLSTDNMLEGQIKNSAIQNSKEAYIILERAKFDTYDLYNFISLDKIKNVISQLESKSEIKGLLEELDIKVL